jgi:hypothetical protein
MAWLLAAWHTVSAAARWVLRAILDFIAGFPGVVKVLGAAFYAISIPFVVGAIPLAAVGYFTGIFAGWSWLSGRIAAWREERRARDPRLGNFVPDVPLRVEDRDFVYLLPVLDQYQTSGLVVQPVPGLPNTYERIGVFEGFGEKLGAIYSPSRRPDPQILTLI